MARPFPTVRDQPAAAYDAVVIGAGVGGLTCAALLARAGRRVLLVEQHYMTGGYCSTFRRSGFVFDAATHFYPLLGNAETLTGRLLRDLGVRTRWIKMDPVDHFHLPDGSTFDVPADFDQYRARLDARFPHERAALRDFFELVRTAYLTGLLQHFRGRPPASGALARLSVRDALDGHFRDERLKLVLTADCPHWGSPPCRTSFVFDSMLRLSYFLGNYYPCGGSQAFADALACSVTAAGGEIMMNTPVTRILIERGAVRGVELLTGPVRDRRRTVVRADVVVSNADLCQTIDDLLPRDACGLEAGARMREMRASYPCFLTHIGLRGVPTELLRARQGYYWDGWDSDRVGVDALRFKLFVPTLYEPAMAPPGGHVLIVQKVIALDSGDVGDIGAIGDAQARKRAFEQFVLARLERLMPGIRGRMVVCLSATDGTHHRYTRNFQGAMLGWEMSPGQLGGARPDVSTGVDGLYLVGHWTRPGGGITPVMMSAVEVARRIAPESRLAAPPAPPAAMRAVAS